MLVLKSQKITLFRRSNMEGPIFSSVARQLTSAIEWMERNGADPQQIVANTEKKLRHRKRFLPREQRIQYAITVLLGEFFSRWAQKNRGFSIAEMVQDAELKKNEMRPFDLALIAASDEKTFARVAPTFARTAMVKRLGLAMGTADGFPLYVMQNTLRIANLFLKKFDVTRPAASRNAVRYLQKIAVSSYLAARTKPISADAPNLLDYLEQSMRLSPRTVLAIKLAYLPTLLSPAERKILGTTYSTAVGPRLPIKRIARILGYRNPAALSRKLYRVRAWCRSSQGVIEEVA
jgi:hypothetical protein